MEEQEPLLAAEQEGEEKHEGRLSEIKSRYQSITAEREALVSEGLADPKIMADLLVIMLREDAPSRV